MNLAKILAEFAKYVEEGADVAAQVVPGIAPEAAAAEFFASVIRRAAERHVEITGQPIDPSLLGPIARVPE